MIASNGPVSTIPGTNRIGVGDVDGPERHRRAGDLVDALDGDRTRAGEVVEDHRFVARGVSSTAVCAPM